MSTKHDLTFRSPDGTDWRVEVRSPGSSNAVVLFHHPQESRRNRYAWFLSHGAEARSVTGRLDPKAVQGGLSDRTLAQLFRKSYAIETQNTRYNRQLSRAV